MNEPANVKQLREAILALQAQGVKIQELTVPHKLFLEVKDWQEHYDNTPIRFVLLCGVQLLYYA